MHFFENSREASGTIRVLHLAVYMAFFAAIAGCDAFAPSTTNPACSEGDIMPIYQCVEGFTVGASKATVEEQIGPFSAGIIADGSYGAWHGKAFRDSSRLAGITLYFREIFRERAGIPGPLDMIVIRAPYEGKTPEGIGVGSALEEVREAYGRADHMYGSGDLPENSDHIYCYGFGKRLTLSFEEGRVNYLTLGYAEPPPVELRVCSGG